MTDRQKAPICPEDTCGHMQCLTWWLTMTMKYPGHDGGLHRADFAGCVTCQQIDARRRGVI